MAETPFRIPKTIAQADMRNVNASAVLEYLRLAESASRTEISQQLKISKPTAMRIIDELEEGGFVISRGLQEVKRGRSRELLGINTSGNLVIAVDIGGGHISGVLADFGGEILHEIHEAPKWGNPEKNFNILVDMIHRVLDLSKEVVSNLRGIAIGIPGITDSDKGIVVHAPSLRWTDFPLIKKLTDHFDLLISIENDVNLAAVGEQWYGAGTGVENMVMIAIGTGIGAGIIMDGKLHRGYNQSSGEIGYLIPGIQYLDEQYPGFGALEILASGMGIADRGTERLKVENPSAVIDNIDSVQVFQAAREGKGWAVKTAEETVDYLSLAVGNIAVCFDPELIVLGGGVSNAADLLIQPIKERLKGVIPVIPRIEKSKLGEYGVILGGVARIFQLVTGYTVVSHG